jgi:hypothetical protein
MAHVCPLKQRATANTRSAHNRRIAMPTAQTKLVFVQLNELNFDLVQQYLTAHELPAFRRLMTGFEQMETFAENAYDHLEPWIQWVSAHSGKTFSEHGVFRLGDGAHSTLPQIFEVLEQRGLSVGAISPMNARNELSKPAFFIPDPWTLTKCDASGFSRRLTAMLRQTVNDNAQGRISVSSLLALTEAVARTMDRRGTPQFLRLIGRAKGRQWYKALVLDQLIHLVHLYELRTTTPNASFVFLNAGAHVQHHYYFNSPFSKGESSNPAWYVSREADPLLDMLKAYDHMLDDYLSMADRGAHVIVATGLTQLPCDSVKFYYRPKHHMRLLNTLGVMPSEVRPRMTRDFEIIFKTRALAEHAANVLASVRMARDHVPLFAEIEDRGLSLFVTLTYPSEIFANDAALYCGGLIENFLQHVSFVAIKNGVHSSKGFAFFSPGAIERVPTEPAHVASLFDLTLEAAGVPTQPLSSRRFPPLVSAEPTG